MRSTDLNTSVPALWTRNFILVFISNLLLFFSFYMLVPVLPFYLLEQLGTNGSVTGIVLSLYTISALLIRPFSGFMVDTFSRKPLYLICYGCFCIIFAGYVVGTTLFLFVILRILHGIAFGISTVSGSTVAVDVMHSERRGEGIGYFGMAANIAMATGPVAGLWIHSHCSFDILFWAAFLSSLIGFFTIFLIKSLQKGHARPETPRTLSLDRFVLVRAFPCVTLFFLVGVGYGCILNYMGLYSQMAGFENNAGLFFILMAAGIVLARLLSARTLNKGKIVPLIKTGSLLLILSFSLFAFCFNALMLYLIAFLLGISFGYITPAFQTMFINLAEHNQRGTANATYFTFWDLGIGLGTAIGGTVIEVFGFTTLYLISSMLVLLGLVYFVFVSANYFETHKLR